MKSKKNIQPEIIEDIVPSQMSDVLIGAFNRYAKAVITDRAIPDVRDGMKPVQRRIIFDMFDQGQVYSKPTVKCATIVGHVMGHYHPHGDSSIYDALVHMSQSWKMEAPLISFQGNNGSIDDDPAAANRYTEARLSLLSEYLVKDIDKDTVEMVPTFDDKSLEPTVLPARFPNLLVNGTSGIAVGSTTYIPPHNLKEVIDATIYRLNHKRATLDDLLTFIPGPDFPTGGIIDDKAALHSLYETGKGSFYLYCRTEINEDTNEIIVKEIPFGTVKISFVADLNKRKEQDKLDNIEEIIDESAKEDIEIIIKVKDGASPDDVLNYLQSKGALRSTISCNFLAIDRGHPRTMSLLDIIDAYIDHQRDIETKACKYDLKKDEDRKEIVTGLMKAYSILKELIEKIQKCNGKEGVKTMLKEDYGFTERQAEAIAMLPLYRLSNTDIVALRNEGIELDNDIKRLNDILSNPDKLDKEIEKTLKEVEKTFAKERYTNILEEKQTFQTVDKTKLIAKEDCQVAVTKDGYAKRTTLKSYKASGDAAKRDNDLSNLPKMKPSDALVFNQQISSHDALLLFTSMGNYAYIPVFMLTDIKWKEEGKHLNNLISLKPNEKIVSAFALNEFKKGVNVVILTSGNKIKRTPLVEFSQTVLTKKPLRACRLSDKDDKVVAVTLTGGNSDVVVVDEMGRASRYNEADIPMVSTSAMGVKAIASSFENCPLVGMISLSTKEVALMLVVSERRAARIILSSKLEATDRLGAKTPLIRVFKKNPMKIVSFEKTIKVKGQPNIVSVTTKESNFVIDLADLTPVEINCEMRENVEGIGKDNIQNMNKDGFVLDQGFVIEEPRPVKVQPAKATEDKADTQLSLFDLFERESKKN